MSFLGIVKTHWLGTTGGPGLTQLAVRRASDGYLTAGDAAAATAAMRQFWATIVAYIPNEVSLTVDPVVDTYVYNSLHNDLETTATAATAPAVVTGTGTSAYSMAAGLRLELNTGTIRYGRRVRGSMFIVPTDVTAFSVTGGTNPAAKTAVEGAFTTMQTSLINNGLVPGVWSRWNKLKHPERPSAFSDVSQGKLNDKTAVLRGRRD